jgi:hypothetical protein
MARPKKQNDITRMTHAELDELEKKIAQEKCNCDCGACRKDYHSACSLLCGNWEGKKMKLYLLERLLSGNYDECQGFVVRASSSKAARKLVGNKDRGDEGKETWLDPKLSTCVEIKTDGEAEIILCDFLAG